MVVVVLLLQDSLELFAVEPLPFCPHLTEVQPLPMSGLCSHAPCQQCGAVGENWVCLTCFEVIPTTMIMDMMNVKKIS